MNGGIHIVCRGLVTVPIYEKLQNLHLFRGEVFGIDFNTYARVDPAEAFFRVWLDFIDGQASGATHSNSDKAHLPAQGKLRNVQDFRSLTNVFLLGDCYEVPEMTKLHEIKHNHQAYIRSDKVCFREFRLSIRWVVRRFTK